MRRLLLIALAVLLLSGVSMAAAQTATLTPTFEGQWCHHFDFSAGQQGFVTLGQGDYAPGGFRTTPAEWGALQVGYTHNLTVFPSQVDIVLEKGPFTSGAVNVELEGELFGLIQEYVQYPMSPDFDVLRLTISPASASDFNNTLSLYVAASKELYLTDIFVYGFGVPPFEDNCNTPAPISTSTPTGTPDACLLPGQPSPTPDGGPTPSVVEYTHDFDGETMPGLTTDDDGGLYDAADEYGFVWRDYTYDLPGGTRVTQVTFTLEFETPVIVQNAAFYVRLFSGLSSYRQNRVTVNYVNGDTGLSTQAAAGSGAWNYVSVNPSAEVAVESITWWAASGSTTGTDATVFVDNFYVRYLLPYAATPWPACTSTPTLTPSLTPTITNTPTPFTLTPSPTRTPTRTPFPIYIPPTFTPRPPTNTPDPSITPSLTSPPPATNTLVPGVTPTGTVGPFEPPGGVTGDGGPGGLRGLGDSITGLGSNLWGRVTGWVGNMTGALTRLTDSWNNSVPTALPYMPQCRTDPLENELCAIWYILTFTVFSGTLGLLIMPLGVAVIDIYFLLVFIRLGRAIITQARQIRS